jgi:hypothetical protein
LQLVALVTIHIQPRAIATATFPVIEYNLNS